MWAFTRDYFVERKEYYIWETQTGHIWPKTEIKC